MSPTKDRLNEMLKIQNGGTKTSTNSSENLKNMNKTFEKVDTIRDNIEIIQINTAKANDILKNNVFKITKAQQDELDSLFKTNTATAYKINNNLKEFEADFNKIEDESSAEFRMKKVQYATLKKEFQEALKDSSNCLEFHRNKRKELLKKSLITTRQDINEEELETLLDQNKLSVFTDNVLITTEEVRQQLSDIEERHQELVKIERHLNDVLDLFIKVATLVEQQQESVDRVEYHAATATDFVEHGIIELDESKRKAKKQRKRKMCLIFIGIIIVIILILIFIVI